MKRCLAVVETVLVSLCVVSIRSSAQTRALGPPAGSTKSAAQEASEAQTPRTSDGHPDLSGVYFPGAEDPDTFQVKGRVNTKFSGPEEKPSYQPWVVEKIKLIGNELVGNPNIL